MKTPKARKIKILPEEIDGIPRVTEYKYLGVTLEGKFGLRKHIKMIKRRCAGITLRLNKFTTRITVEHRRVLWNALYRPHFEYVAALIPQCCKTEQETWKKPLDGWFKRTVRFSRSFPNKSLRQILNEPLQWAKEKYNNLAVKVIKVFPALNLGYFQGENNLCLTRNLMLLPEEFPRASKLINSKICSAHNLRLSLFIYLFI